MQLKKWASNTKEILNNITPEDSTIKFLTFNDSVGLGVKVLGLHWNHQDDTFHYVVQAVVLIPTKRSMLSLIARIFDPLGLLAPTIFFAKQILQRVWKLGVSWDEQFPTDIVNEWKIFVADLPFLQQVTFPRFVGTQFGVQCQLCGFCDAYEKGYAAVVYLKLENGAERPVVTLLGAKTKMAPIKSSTIPRLELCAALLLSYSLGGWHVFEPP